MPDSYYQDSLFEGVIVEKDGGEKLLFDEWGRLTEITSAPIEHATADPPTIQIHHEEDASLNEIDYITDGVGRRYEFTYNTQNCLTSIKVFDQQNSPITVGSGSPAVNLAMTYTYDNYNRLTGAVYPDGETVTYSYASNPGLPLLVGSMTDINGYRLSYEYNSAYAVTQITEEALNSSSTYVEGNVVDITYDSPYQRTFEESYGNSETVQFDKYGRKTAVYDNEGNYYRHTYEDTIIDGNTYNLLSDSSLIEDWDDNILVNADFENGLTGWTGSGLGQNDGAATVSWFGETVDAIKINGNPAESKSISQAFAITGELGDTIKVGCWAKAKAVSNSCAIFRIRLVYTDTSTQQTETETVDFVPNTGHWQFVDASFILKGACSSATVYLDYGNQINEAYFTDARAIYKAKTMGAQPDDDESEIMCACGDNCEYGIGCDCPCANELTCTCLQCKVTTTNTYDDYGNIESTTVTDFNKELVTESTYTSDGNYLTSSSNSAGNVISYNYNTNNGTLTSVTDGRNNAVSYTYNAMRALAGVTQAVTGLSTGSSISNSYSYTDDRLASIETGNGVEYTFDYDLWGNLAGVNVGTQSLAEYTYGTNANRSRPASMTYGNGQTMTLSYDSDNNITGISCDGGTTWRYAYAYSEDGRLTSLTDNASGQITTYTEDGYEIHTNPQGGQGVLLYSSSYDEDEHFVQTANGYTYTYAHGEDDYNRTTGATVSGSTVSSLGTSLSLSSTTDFFGRKTGSSVTVKDGTNDLGSVAADVTYQNGTGNRTTEFVGSYKNIVTPTTGSAVNIEYTYTYDNNGNITTESLGGVLKYTYYYDEANQLTRVNDAVQNKTFVFVYDNGGNITSKIRYAYTTGTLGTAEQTINFAYGDSNWKDKLTSYGSAPLTYDAIGNLTSFGGNTFTWTAGRQLAKLEGPNDYSIEYTYNADGLRTRKVIDDPENWYSVTYDYIWADGKLISRTDGTNSLYFIYDENNSPIAFTVNDTDTYLYIKNLQGDITGIANENGAVIANYTYDAWGKLVSVTGSAANTIGSLNPLRYRGYYYDSETAYYYLQSRYYSPALGRFLNADDTKMLGNLNSNLIANIYMYCYNNPIKHCDNTGLDVGGRPTWMVDFICFGTTTRLPTFGYIANKTQLLALPLWELVSRVIYGEQTQNKNNGQEGVTWTIANRLLSKSTEFTKGKAVNLFNIITCPSQFTAIDKEGGNELCYTAKTKNDTGWLNALKLGILLWDKLEINPSSDKTTNRNNLTNSIKASPIGKACFYRASRTFYKYYNKSNGTYCGTRVKDIVSLNGNVFFNYYYISN